MAEIVAEMRARKSAAGTRKPVDRIDHQLPNQLVANLGMAGVVANVPPAISSRAEEAACRPRAT